MTMAVKMFDLVSAPKEFTDLPEPKDPYYIAAKQGLYVYKKGPLGQALLRINTLPETLNPIPSDIEKGQFIYSAPKLPLFVMGQIINFFRTVYDKHKAEAEVLILYNSKATTHEQFMLFCPYQRVSGASVHSLYDPTTIPNGYQAIGTAHSHCNMDAFHSGTDTTDATSFPGLHLTIGHITYQTGPTFAAMVMLNGSRFDYQIEEVAVIPGIADKLPAFPPFWLERIVTSGEKDRAKVLADTIDNVTEDQKKDFLQTYTAYKPYTQPHRPWNPDRVVAHNQSQMWGLNDDPEWEQEYWNQIDARRTRKPHATRPSQHTFTAQRWSQELRMNVPASLVDTAGRFEDTDAVISALTIVLGRLKDFADDHALELNYEINDAATGSTIIFSMPDWQAEIEEAEEAAADDGTEIEIDHGPGTSTANPADFRVVKLPAGNSTISTIE